MRTSVHTDTIFSGDPSRPMLEWAATIGAAVFLAAGHNFSSLSQTLALLGLIVVVPVVFRKAEYAVYLLAVLMPLRDVHLVSVLFLHRALIWGLFLWTVVRQMTHRDIAFSRNLAKFTRYAIWFVIAVGVALLMTLSKFYNTFYITPDTFKSMLFGNALVIVENLLLLYILYFSLRTIQHIWRFLSILLVNSLFIAVLAILQYLANGIPPVMGFLFDPDYVFYGRATSVFSSPNNLGHFLAPIASMLLIVLLFKPMRRWLKYGMVLPALLITGCAIVLSFSRGAMLTLFFSVLSMGYFYYVHLNERKPSIKLIVLVLLIVLMVVAAFQYYDVYLRLRLAEYTDQDYRKALNWIRTSSDFGRKFAATEAFKTFLQHPFWGIGFDVFLGEQISGDYAVDNQYLKILVDMGVFGFVPFVLMLALILRTGIRTWKAGRARSMTDQENLLFLMFLTSFATLLFSNLFAETLHLRALMTNLWMFSGSLFVLDRMHGASHWSGSPQA